MSRSRPLIGLDFDGTLVSCQEKQIFALEEARALLGLPCVDYGRIWTLKRDGLSTKDALIATDIDPAAARRVALSWTEIVETAAACDKDILLPGVREALTTMVARADLLLLSARRSFGALERQLKSLNLLQFFVHVETVSPLSGASTAKAESLRRHRACCYIGDSESDLAAAEAAGIPFYLLCTGQRSRAFFERTLAPRTIHDSLLDVASMVGQEMLDRQHFAQRPFRFNP